MIIAKSNVQLASYHQKSSVSAVSERLRAWTDGGGEEILTRDRTIEDEEGGRNAERAVFDFELELEKVALKAREERLSSGGAKKTREDDDLEDDGLLQHDTKLEIMRLIVEKLSGKKVSLYSGETDGGEGTDESTPGRGDALEAGEAAPREGFGIEYDYKEVHLESETTRFESQGVVTTADGRRIDFEVNLEMHRERLDVTSFTLRAGDAGLVDPLVVNFGAEPAALTESKIAFDLDQDGEEEMISFVQSGSGFLVLDKNGDGVVNNGGELFGPSSGDGFSELSRYDEDRNGWIDEADAVYDALRIWTRPGGNVGQLRTLSESDVGAIYLGKVDTPFELVDSRDNLTGQVQSSGVFIKESGEVGTIQQVDLVT